MSLSTYVRSSKFLRPPSFLVSKLFLSLLSILFFVFNSVNLFPINPVPKDFNCIYDRTFTLSSSLNRFLDQSEFWKNVLIIYSSILMDAQFCFMMASFTMIAKNWRFPIAFTLFYMMRGILQSLFIFSIPKDYIWGHPGFFSLTISYARTSDFFYSGHVGSSALCVLEFSKYQFFDKRFKYLKYFSAHNAIGQAFIQIVYRGHYFIDVFCGFVFAHYFYLIVEKILPDDAELVRREMEEGRREMEEGRRREEEGGEEGKRRIEKDVTKEKDDGTRKKEDGREGEGEGRIRRRRDERNGERMEKESRRKEGEELDRHEGEVKKMNEEENVCKREGGEKIKRQKCDNCKKKKM